MQENWVPVRGWEGFYEVSDQGRVKSLPRVTYRKNGWPVTVKERILKPSKGRKNVYSTLMLQEPGRKQSIYLHVLVAEHFCEGKAPGLEVCHNNGNKQDCRAENLRWDTRRENMLDRSRHKAMGINTN